MSTPTDAGAPSAPLWVFRLAASSPVFAAIGHAAWHVMAPFLGLPCP